VTLQEGLIAYLKRTSRLRLRPQGWAYTTEELLLEQGEWFGGRPAAHGGDGKGVLFPGGLDAGLPDPAPGAGERNGLVD
jgi:hypothetical protein